MRHFCTLFDKYFLVAGLCLHESLLRHEPTAHLWILCLDETVHQQLELLALSRVTLLTRSQIETDRLLKVKPTRTAGEYCWTLTPFLPSLVFLREPSVDEVTYLDADLYFFGAPSTLLDELAASRAHVLITEHAFDPAYDQSATAGRFCVQFVTFRNTPDARGVLQWWQERCLEWCYARHEEGKFGDQKYLDQWPSLFGEKVHILRRKELALAPWNARYYLEAADSAFRPVFYHFHGLRLNSPSTARLFFGYKVGKRAKCLYLEYVAALSRAASRVVELGAPVPYFPEARSFATMFRNLRYRLTGRTAVAKLDAG